MRALAGRATRAITTTARDQRAQATPSNHAHHTGCPISCKRFLGLGPGDAVPDANTLWTFPEALTRAGAVERLFALFDRELGALTTLVQVVTILGILNRLLVQPYVSRYHSQEDFRNRALRVLGVYTAGASLLLLLAWLFPQPFLLILGSQYTHLSEYVLPAMALAVFSLGGAVAYWLCLSSGRPGGLSLTIPFNLAIQVGYVSLVGLATVDAALGFMLVTAAGEFVVRLAVLTWLGVRPGTLAAKDT